MLWSLRWRRGCGSGRDWRPRMAARPLARARARACFELQRAHMCMHMPMYMLRMHMHTCPVSHVLCGVTPACTRSLLPGSRPSV
mmetsp:Transcript_51302/g.151248  ORF Transcript_51302/g.151248 Transcript_51302/m.151248 type:complete len:84 (-) Transcript_51302:83-334(-)